MKTIKFLFLIFCLTSLNSCGMSSFYNKFPGESFVKVHTKMTVQVCKDSSNDMSSCQENNFYSVGSGSVVHHKKGKTFILTAGHVCHSKLEGPLKKVANSVKVEFKVQNAKDEWYVVKVYNVSPHFINGNELDLCLLESDGIINMPALHLALSGPKVGEKVYNVAAPTGFFSPPTIPLLDGYYSGPLGEYHSLVTVPAIGGSSGSPVLNSRGELIGLIFAANLEFQHLAISIRYEVLRKYLQSNLYP